MLKRPYAPPRTPRLVLLSALLLAVCAQQTPALPFALTQDAERKRAMELYEASNYVAAIPLLWLVFGIFLDQSHPSFGSVPLLNQVQLEIRVGQHPTTVLVER